tara:strand:- start:266 stop:895 length:630 start_codon:yes stop_codon:yes gene_type:complete
MVDIYVLKLVRGKYYVGMTRRNIERIWEHIGGEGAKWTEKYPPVRGKEIVSYQSNLHLIDEDRITLETMFEYGIQNVRGGKWCQIVLPKKTVRNLEKEMKKMSSKPRKTKSRPEIGEYYKKKAMKKKTRNREKVIRCNGIRKDGNPCRQVVGKKGEYCQYHSDQKRGRKRVICAKCNRVGHESKDCYAKTRVAGTGVLAGMERYGLPKR